MSMRRWSGLGKQVWRAWETQPGLFDATSHTPCHACLQSSSYAKLPFPNKKLTIPKLKEGASGMPIPAVMTPARSQRSPVEDPLAEADLMRDAAKAVTASMLPWERRQMDGNATALNRWEKIYWGAFVTAVVSLIGLKIYNSFEKPPPKIDEDEEAKKDALAVEFLSGRITILECEDFFEGMESKEVIKFAEKALARKKEVSAVEEDEFYNMTPDEINAHVQAQGQPAT